MSFLFLAALNYESRTSYKLQVQVTDGGNIRRSTLVDIHVIVTDTNEGGPFFSDAVFITQLDEDVSIGQTVYMMYAKDADQSSSSFYPVVYSIISGDPTNRFIINSDNGQVLVKAKLDYETTRTYAVIVQAAYKTGSNSATATLSVVVNDVNDNRPVCADWTFNREISELVGGGIAIFTLSCNDDDNSIYGQLTYELTTGDAAKFRITSSVLELVKPIDYDTEGTQYDLVITVSDGLYAVDVTGTLYVSDVNEHDPMFTEGGKYRFRHRHVSVKVISNLKHI